MRRLEIILRQKGGEPRRIVLGRFASVLASLLLVLLTLIVAAALVLGYVVLGIVLAISIVALFAGLLASAARNVRK